MIEPIIRRESAPDHRAGFWQDLEASMTAPTEATPPREATVRGDSAGSGETGVIPTPDRSDRRLWPLAAAAMLLAVVGLTVLLLPQEGSRTELVVAPTDDAVQRVPDVAAAGGDSEDDPTQSSDIAGEASASPTDAPAAEVVGDAAAEPTVAPEPENAAPVTTYPAAPGNDDTEVWLPSRPLPEGTRFLATWEDADLSWFGLVDESQPCSSDDYAQVVHVTPAGFALPIVEHVLGFSGAISHFTMSPDATGVAFLAACDGRLEFYVARTVPAMGELTDLRLAWVGSGSEATAFVIWVDGTVSLNGIDRWGSPFHVDVDPAQGVVTGSGLPVEPEPARDSWIVGATSGGEYSYWNVRADDTCDGEALFLRTGGGTWRPALLEPIDAGAIVAFDIDHRSSRVAFADACGGINGGRLFLGTLRADGLISSVRTISLAAFATGHVSMLDWVDGQRLQIQTDETVTAGTRLRFDYVFDDGGDAGVLVLVD